MITTWKKYCPYNTEKQPGLRRAWRGGWFYEKGQGTVKLASEVLLPVFYPAWLNGYFEADEHRRKVKPEVHSSPGVPQ